MQYLALQIQHNCLIEMYVWSLYHSISNTRFLSPPALDIKLIISTKCHIFGLQDKYQTGNG